jgi:S-formylglutathione hydrolase
VLDGWTRVAIGGKAADAFDPPGALPLALVYLHSLAGESPATDPALTAALGRHRLRCLAPRGGRCWWADRLCPEFDAALTPERYLLDVLVPWAVSAWQIGPHGVALTGAEMGGQGAVRIAFKHPERFPVAASTSGAFDCQEWYGHGTPLDEMYDTRERCRLDTAILHIDAHDWPRHLWFGCSPTDTWCYRGNDRLHEKLAAMGVPHVADLDSDDVERMKGEMVAFVAGALAKEARRLV